MKEYMVICEIKKQTRKQAKVSGRRSRNSRHETEMGYLQLFRLNSLLRPNGEVNGPI